MTPYPLNQQKYLELMERILQECEKPEFDPARAIDGLLEEQLPPRWDRIIAGMLLPRASALHGLVLEDEVRRQFALAALQARREGVEAARAEIARRIDPFSGEPFRTRVEANGTLVLWSAGPDGIDDEARWNAEEEEEYEDVVWRFRPAQ